MADTKIEWANKVWNAVRGCTRVSEGCRNCYAERQAIRQVQGAYAGLVKSTSSGPRWTGAVALDEAKLEEPLHWKKPCRVFVNSMGDLFHAAVPFEFIDRVFSVMAGASRHTFQVLTKRPDRMLEYLAQFQPCARATGFMTRNGNEPIAYGGSAEHGLIADNRWPLPNVWLGVSVEDQKTADERIPLLLQTPAAVRWISAEPLLGPIDWKAATPTDHHDFGCKRYSGGICDCQPAGIDWVVCGGESGPNARPMHPDWARSLRDQCQSAGVPFFFKQWGEWAPGECASSLPTRTERCATYFANEWDYYSLTPKESEETNRDDEPDVYRLGKRAAGRLLDGQEWNQYPEAR